MSRAEKRIEPVQPLDAASIKAVAPGQPKTHTRNQEDISTYINHKLMYTYSLCKYTERTKETKVPLGMLVG